MKRSRVNKGCRGIAMMMAFFLVMLTPASYATIPVVEAEESVLSDALLEVLNSEEIKGNPTAKIDCMVWFENVIDDEIVVEMTEEETGLSLEELTDSPPLLSEEDYWSIKDLDDEEFAEKMEELIDQDAKAEAEEKSLLMNDFILAKREISSSLYEKMNVAQMEVAKIGENEVSYVSRYSPTVTMEMTAERIYELAEMSNVESIGYVGDFEAVEEGISVGTVVSDAKGNYVRDTLGWTGSGVDVAIIEANTYVTNASGIDDLILVDRENGTLSSPGNGTDGYEHANLVGAILAGNDGFAPDATVYSGVAGGFNKYKSIVEVMLDKGVVLINASLNAYSNITGTYSDADEWSDHITSEHNVTLVTSAGNREPSNDALEVTAPGMAYNAITVGNHNGSTVKSDSAYNEYSGTDADLLRRPEKPDLVARGSNSIEFSGSTTTQEGTSFASPAVAGTLAQLMEGNANLKYRPTLAKAIVCAGCRYWCGTYTRIDGIHSYSDKEGAGKLNAKCAASILSAGRFYYTSNGYTSNAPITRTVNVTSNDAVLKICMTWEKRNFQDGRESSELANWNLEVYNPNGTKIHTSTGLRNNVELIYFAPSGVYGTYTIKAVKVSGEATREYLSIAWY